MDQQLSNLDVIVKSFNRPDKINVLVRSWNHFYPDISLTICDDSSIDMPFENDIYKYHRVMKLPNINEGISAGRNYGIDNTSKDYIMFLDDDFEITNDTIIKKLITLFEIRNDIGIVGGVMGKRNREAVIQGGEISLTNSICKKSCLGERLQIYKGISYRFCSMTDNFFIAKREIFKDVKWDNSLKVGEHTDFFLQISNTNWKVIFTPDVLVDHNQTTLYDNYYKKYRYDDYSIYKRLFWEKYGIKKEIYCDEQGNVRKEWLTSYARVDFDIEGKILPYSSKLYGYVVGQIERTKNNKSIIEVISTQRDNTDYLPGKKYIVDLKMIEEVEVFPERYRGKRIAVAPYASLSELQND